MATQSRKTQHNGDVELEIIEGLSNLHVTGMATDMAQALAAIAERLLQEAAKTRKPAPPPTTPIQIKARTRGLALTLVVAKDGETPTPRANTTGRHWRGKKRGSGQ